MHYSDTQDKILFCDVESSGTDWKINGIHQLAGIIEIDGVEVKRFDLKMRLHPFDIINPGSLEISGVSKEIVDKYPPMDVVYRDFYDIITEFVDPGDPLDRMYISGYSSQSMEKFFIQEWLKKNASRFWKAAFHNITLDSSCYAIKHLLKNKMPLPASPTLENIARALGIPVDRSKLHNAVYDTEIARLIFKQTL